MSASFKHDTPSTLNSVFFKKHDVFAHPHYAFEKKIQAQNRCQSVVAWFFLSVSMTWTFCILN